MHAKVPSCKYYDPSLMPMNHSFPSGYPNSHARNLLLVHGYTVDMYRREYRAKQGGQIGITLVGIFRRASEESSECLHIPLKNCDWAAPIDDSPEAKTCAEQSLASVLGWVSLGRASKIR